MEIIVSAKYIRMSPRKVKLIADEIKYLKPINAVNVLMSLPKSAAEPVRKLILSAIASAKQKQIDSEKLTFKIIEVTSGPSMKRWRAVSRGRAHAYKKRMTHMRIVLTDEKENGREIKIDNGGDN